MMPTVTYEFSWTTQKRFYAANPPTGSNIRYYLKSEQSDSSTVEILDVAGNVLRTLEGLPAESVTVYS